MPTCLRLAGVLLGAGLLSVDSSEAQHRPIERGSLQLAGTAQLVHSHDIGNDQGATIFEVAPRVGFFVVPGLAVNANLRFARISGDGPATTGWGLGPGLTYYIGGLSSRIYPFVSGRTLFTWQRTPSPGGDPDVKFRTTSWLVSGGALFLVAEQVGITSELFYQRDRFTFEFGSASTNSAELYGVQWGVAVFVH